MHRQVSRSIILLALVLSVTFLGSAYLAQPASGVSSNPNAKDVTFYWHYHDSPVSVASFQTHEVLNTTTRFKFLTEQDAKGNSFYKPTGLPQITVDFYLYPNLVAPTTFDGTWQVLIWVNASASTPVAFQTRFKEYPLGSGVATWDSGLLTPIVTSPVGSNLGVPVYSYNLSMPAPLTHTFAQSSTIDVSVVVNPGAANDARIWYDSPLYPSKVILPAVDRARPAKIWTEDSTGLVKSVFPASPGLKVVVKANATDPFGGYDINATTAGTIDARVTLTVTAPDTSIIVNAQRMTLISGGLFTLNNIFQYNLTLSGIPGDYRVMISVTDNSGNIEQSTFTFTLGQTYRLTATIVDSKSRPLPGSILTAWASGFQVFSATANSTGVVNRTVIAANYTLRVSWQGVTVYEAPYSISSDVVLTLTTAVYDPKILVVDDAGAALSEALVSVTHPNGTTIPTLFTTATDGSVSLVRVPAGGFRFIVLWKAVTVHDATVQVSSDGPYTLKTMVYQLTVTVRDKTGAPVQGAYVVLYNVYGVVYDFKVTDSGGSVTLRVPVGTYKVEALYSTTYMFTPVTSAVTQSSVAVSSSGSVTLTLPDYPPGVISTSAFYVILLVIIGVAVAGLVTYLMMRRRLPGLLAKLHQKSPGQQAI